MPSFLDHELSFEKGAEVMNRWVEGTTAPGLQLVTMVRLLAGATLEQPKTGSD